MNRPKNYINRIVFNDGTKMDINENDIIVFVGPNNAGKSQALKDIYELSNRKQPSVVVSDIGLHRETEGLKEFISSFSNKHTSNGIVVYEGFKFQLIEQNIELICENNALDDLRDALIVYLDTMERLRICHPAPFITRKDNKTNPIHYAAFDKSRREWLSAKYKMAFDQYLVPNMQFGASIPLCIGDPVKFDKDFEDEQSRQEAYAEILQTYKQVHDQGDGIKSFTGILLYLMIDHYSTYLIDEPESFLHPPQAHIMGQIIGEALSDNQQAFISTHSEEIIKGLLDEASERVKIIRITREGDLNRFSMIDNRAFKLLWKDPLLKYSNIMSALFHSSVILCESDSDCKMYSLIESQLMAEQGKYSESLYIHSGGKQRLSKVVAALKSIGIYVKTLPDIDILNDENIVKGLVEAHGGSWDKVKRDYNIIVNNLHSPKESINREHAKEEIIAIIETSDFTELNKEEIKKINDCVKIISKWDILKKSGKSALPSGDATQAFGRMNSYLEQLGIFLVPVGEIECFIKEVGAHGPQWVNQVLEKYPDLQDPIYSSIKDYVKGVLGIV